MRAQKITTAGFLSEFLARHKKMADRPFCWVLGSGASFQSGIPTGGTLAMQWLKELHELEDFENLPLEKWATEATLRIKGFDFKKAANFYPFIYQRRFHDFREEGYAFLEDAMDLAEPSYGYSVFAQLMAGTQHKVAVTTNFDNLIADAISVYTRAFPLVCGHESLTGFIRPNLTRPVVAKIHRDLLLNPKSEPEEIEKLPPEWETALKVIFDNNTPIVIGYGGNDGSLMGFFKKLEPIRGGIFWCYLVGEEPDEKVHQIVEHHHGRLVPILGFDELMLQLWEKLQLPSPIPELQATHDKRKADFQTQFEELNKKLKEPGKSKATETELKQVRATAAAAVERLTKEKDWWAWQLKANAESDSAKREAIFREGLGDFPESAELTGNFALFMETVPKRYDEAERLFRRAMELDPKDADYAGNFALFMENVRKNYDEAERLYLKTMELDPKPGHTGNFANFMFKIRKNYGEAEQLYLKTLELDPKNAVNNCNFAVFKETVRKDYDEAERFYRKALELDPKEAKIYSVYAEFVERVRKNPPEANRLYRLALELDANLDYAKKQFERFKKEHPEFDK